MKPSCMDDKFAVTEIFQRWLECDSSVPRTWGGIMLALRRNFCCEEIPDTCQWVDGIIKELVRKYGCIQMYLSMITYTV